MNSISLRDNKPHPLFLHNSCTPQYLLTDCKQGHSQLPFPFILPPPQISAQLDSTIAHITYLAQIRPENFLAFYAVLGQLSYVCRLPEWTIILCNLSSLQLPSSAALAHVSVLSEHSFSPVHALSLQLGKTTVGRFLAWGIINQIYLLNETLLEWGTDR